MNMDGVPSAAQVRGKPFHRAKCPLARDGGDGLEGGGVSSFPPRRASMLTRFFAVSSGIVMIE